MRWCCRAERKELLHDTTVHGLSTLHLMRYAYMQYSTEQSILLHCSATQCSEYTETQYATIQYVKYSIS